MTAVKGGKRMIVPEPNEILNTETEERRKRVGEGRRGNERQNEPNRKVLKTNLRPKK